MSDPIVQELRKNAEWWQQRRVIPEEQQTTVGGSSGVTCFQGGAGSTGWTRVGISEYVGGGGGRSYLSQTGAAAAISIEMCLTTERQLLAAADALDAAHQREAALREALEQIANTTTTVTGGVSGFARGVDIPVSVDGTKEFARRVLAERAGVRPQGEPR